MEIFGYLSGIMSALSFTPYILDVLKKKTRPHRVSWLIWLTLGLISFFSQRSAGAEASLWMTGVQTLGVVIVFLLSLVRGVGGFSRKDMLAFSLAFLSIVLWVTTSNPGYGIFFAIGIDFIGASLTIAKAYKDPYSETFSAWFLAFLAGLLGCLAVGQINFLLLAYPVYIAIANFATIYVIYSRRMQVPRRVSGLKR